ncbi:MAG: MFS transporter [Caulobacteraceae bacterium]
MRRLPPVWLMGLGFPIGVFSAVAVITVPSLLSQHHVREPVIAAITTLAIFSGFLSFLLAPLLDWRFSRRVWALFFACLTAASVFAALMSLSDPRVLAAVFILGGLAYGLLAAAVGGWFGAIVADKDKVALGAWLTVGNFASGGVAAALAIPILRDLPEGLGAGVLALLVLSVVPLLVLTPCPKADGRLASESFAAFFADVLALLRRPVVLLTLVLFILPAASFALTNTLGGLGADFHASAALVGKVGGVGTVLAGIFGALLVPPLARRLSPRPLYLAVGASGAAFTLLLLALPRIPAVFALAFLGESIFQAAAGSVQSAITLRTIAPGSPLAATQFGLLVSASILPLAYMQALDGTAYGLFGGLSGALCGDALFSLAAVVVLAALLWRLRRAPFLAIPLAEGEPAAA